MSATANSIVQDPVCDFEGIFDRSYERVKCIQKNGRSFFDEFYRHFRDSSPVVRAYFSHTDMARQKKMLEKSFYSLLIYYATNNANDYLNRIAEKHGKRGAKVSLDMYDYWMESLIKTVSVFDPEYDDNVELAWRMVLSAGITYMKFKYDK